MSLLAAILLLATIPHEITVRESVDLIERNHFYNDEGREVFTQWIFWDWERDRHQVEGWRNNQPDFRFTERPPLLTWSQGTERRQVRSTYWRETWTQHDPELFDREIVPKDRRKGIGGQQ